MALKSTTAKRREAERAIINGEFALLQGLHHYFQVYLFKSPQIIRIYFDDEAAEARESLGSSAICLWQSTQRKTACEIRTMMAGLYGPESHSMISLYLEKNFLQEIEW